MHLEHSSGDPWAQQSTKRATEFLIALSTPQDTPVVTDLPNDGQWYHPAAVMQRYKENRCERPCIRFHAVIE
jgi:hypothetical protein